jgi:DNA processing protein
MIFPFGADTMTENELPTLFEETEDESNDSLESMNIDSLRELPEPERVAFLQLSLVEGIGTRMMARLLQRFGTPSNVLRATLRELENVCRVGPKLASNIRNPDMPRRTEEVLQICESQKIEILYPFDPRIPSLLMEIPDPPVLLYMQGAFTPEDSLSIGLVGTRHATAYGRYMAERLTKGLCNYGCTIVSGLARGIDGVCHRKAIDAGGRTIAVLGSSLTEIYPPEHKDLAKRIIDHGVLLSETPPKAKPKAGVFPQRNRIISGLSLGIVVIEAAERSGSLITARHAGEQGRDVFAVPGQASAPTSRGSNRLIRDGALLVQDAEDIMEHLGPLTKTVQLSSGDNIQQPNELILNEVERQVLQAIDGHATDIDQIVMQSGLPVSRVLSTLSVLEIQGFILRTGGRSYSRKYPLHAKRSASGQKI